MNRGRLARLDERGKGMNTDRDQTQTSNDDTAAIDQVEDRVQAEMKRLEGNAKERAGQGMQNSELEREGRQLKEEGENELSEQDSQQ
jgi:uncharacterized protein YjbJ (UPF0337 family)